ncbi:hypothetical protein MY10362_002348, partial [Beauveria mimosiformis]
MSLKRSKVCGAAPSDWRQHLRAFRSRYDADIIFDRIPSWAFAHRVPQLRLRFTHDAN